MVYYTIPDCNACSETMDAVREKRKKLVAQLCYHQATV